MNVQEAEIARHRSVTLSMLRSLSRSPRAGPVASGDICPELPTGVGADYRAAMNDHSRRDPRAALKMRLRELAASRVRFGHLRLTVILRIEGWRVNPKRVYRLYTEDRLTVRTRVRKKLARRSRVATPKAMRPGAKWGMD